MLKLLFAGLAFALPTVACANEVADLTALRTNIEAEFPEWTVVAVCGSSSGKSYFVQELQKGWQDDQVSSGNLIFLRDGRGEPDVLFIDAMQDPRSSRLEGAQVVELFVRQSTQEHVWLAAYASTGTTETYALSLGGPIKLVMWSQGRPSIQVGLESGRKIEAKMAAFVARCV